MTEHGHRGPDEVPGGDAQGSPAPATPPGPGSSPAQDPPDLGTPSATAAPTGTGTPSGSPAPDDAPTSPGTTGFPAAHGSEPGTQGHHPDATWAPASPQTGYAPHGWAPPGWTQPFPAHPGAAHPGTGQPGTDQPGAMPPGTGYPGSTGVATAAPYPPARQTGRWRIGLAGLVAGALIGGGAGAGVVALTDHSSSTPIAGAPAQNVVIKDPHNATTATAAAAKAAPSVVTIYVTNNSSAGSGSGVILTADGYVLTNNHVVTLEGAGTGTVQVRTSDGNMYDATVVGTDASSDLAVVKLNGAKNLKPATFADSDKVQVGDVAVAIGAPLGLSNTVTDGIISATQRAVATGSTQNDSTVIDAIQTDAAINPGNSGGALVNGAGEVIGINTAIATVASEGFGQQSQSGNIGVGFAIPSNTAKRIAGEIIKTGSATHAVLGVSARTATSGSNPEAGLGAQIVQVEPGSGADKAGLKSGDVITAVGDRGVTSSVDLTAAIRSSAPGSNVELTVRRGNGTQHVQVTLGSTTS